MNPSEKSTSIQRTITRSAVWLIVVSQVGAALLALWALQNFRAAYSSLRHTDFAMGIQDEIARRGASTAAFHHVADSALKVNSGIYLLFVDAHGVILESAPALAGGRIEGPEIEQSMQPLLLRDALRLRTRSFIGYDALFSSAPAQIAGRSGVLLVLLPQYGFPLRQPILIALGSLLFGAIAAVLIVRRLVRSQLRGVVTISEATRDYLAGATQTRAPLLPPGEVNDLGQLFNRLADGSEALRTRIEATEAERRTLLAGLVHDLSAPVTSIVGFVALAKESLARAATEEARDHLRRVLRATDRLSPLIQNLGKLGRLELERLQPRLTQVDLARLLAQTVETLHGAARRKGVAVECTSEAGLRTIEGDEELLRRVFENLLSNAVRFTLAGGSVSLRARQDDEQVTVEITDTGVGIAEHQRAEIFGEYVQAASRGEGVGLGLSLVKRFVDAHGGTITVESQLGVGSTFRVSLPIASLPLKRETVVSMRAERERPDLLRLAVHCAGGLALGAIPLTLGEPPRASYAFFGCALGMVPILTVRFCRSRAASFALLIPFMCAIATSIAMLRRPELMLIGVTAAILASFPISLSFVRSFSVGIATRIGYALIATGFVAVVFAASSVWFSIHQQRVAPHVERGQALLRASIELISSLFAESHDLDRALYSFQSLSPLLSAVVRDETGKVRGESFPEAEFGELASIDPPLTGAFGQAVTIDSASFRSPGKSRALVGSIELFGKDQLFLLLDNRRSQELCRMLYESAAFQFITVGSLMVIGAGIALALRIQRLIRPRLIYALDLLDHPRRADLPPVSIGSRCDEIDGILGALQLLIENVRTRELALEEAQRTRCDLIARVYHSLEDPLEELRFQLAAGLLPDAGAASLSVALERISAIVDAEQLLLRELNEYARTTAQSRLPQDDVYRVDELLQDIVLKLDRSGTRITLKSVGPAPFIEHHVSLINKILQFAIEARLSAQRSNDALRCEVEHREKLIAITLIGRAPQVVNERDSMLFAEIRRAIVEGYLEQLGGSISEHRIGSETRTEIALPAA